MLFLHRFLTAIATAIAVVCIARADSEPTANGRNATGPMRTDLYGDPLPRGAVARLGTVRFRHASEIVWLAFGSDSKTLVSFEHDGTVHTWETATGRERFHLRLPTVAGKFGPGINKSLDGRMLVTWSGESSIRVWDAAGKLLHALTADGVSLGPASLTADTEFLAAIGTVLSNGEHMIFVWELASSKQAHALAIPEPEGWQTGPTDIDISLEGRGKLVLAQLSHEKQVALRLWDVASGKRLSTFADNPQNFSGCVLTPDAKSVVTFEPSLRVLDIASGKESRRFGPVVGGEVAGVRFSPDGRTMAAAASRKSSEITVHIWEIATGKRLLGLGPEDIADVIFSPDGRRLAVSRRDWSVVRLYNLETGVQIREFDAHTFQQEIGHQTGVGLVRPERLDSMPKVAFSQDGTLLAVVPELWWYTPESATIRVWEIATGTEQRPVTAAHEAAIEELAVSPDGKLVASASSDGTLRLWEPAGRQLRVLPLPGAGRVPPPSSTSVNTSHVTFAPNGATVAASSPFNLVGIWEARTGKRLLEFLDEGGAASLTYAVDGRHMFTGDPGRVRCWDIASAKMVHEFSVPKISSTDTSGPAEVDERQVGAVSPDGRFLAARCSYTSGLCLWELASGKLCRRWNYINPRSDCVPLVQFSPDSKTLLWNSEDALELLEVRTGKRLRQFGAYVFRLAFAPTGNILATLGSGGLMRLLDPSNGTILAEVKSEQADFSCVCFSPDGKRIFTGLADSTITCWDVAEIRRMWTNPPRKLANQELDDAWGQLGSEDAAAVSIAMERLVGVPEQTVILIGARLRPAAPVGAGELDGLVADLNSDHFAVRDRAAKTLERMEKRAEPFLRAQLAKAPTTEVHQRLEQLLEKSQGFVTLLESLQELRGVELLEDIGTPQAKKVLENLAKGDPAARLTREAKAALARLNRPVR